ncbi:MAG TPA: hypothetical protein VGM88_09110 [Kofleriaceae bacterium]|jgi:hypothetical protein
MKPVLVLAALAALAGVAAADAKVKTHVPTLTGGTFAVSDPSADGDLRATALPLSILVPEQRAGDLVTAPEDYELIGAPFSGIGTYRVKGKPRLALVPANVTPPPDAPEDTIVFSPVGDARPFGKDLRWRIWRSPAAPPLDAIALEDRAGHLKALRFVGPTASIAAVSLGPDAPAFVVAHLDGASGIDDPITFELVGGALESLLSVEGGPRSYDEKPKKFIGPPGALTVGARGIEAREVKGAYNTCTPGALMDAGCPGTVTTYAWAGALKAGAARPVTVVWKGGKVIVK